MTAAQKNAAVSETAEVEYDGETYTIPTAENWPISVMEHVENDKVVGALRALLGDSQWDTFTTKSNKIKHIEGMWEAANKAVGSGN